MFEMKNEDDASAASSRHKNADFFKKLDQDRRNKNCEYAVLVSMLEPESELYNSGIVDVSYEYEKMYVIRPQFFIPMRIDGMAEMNPMLGLRGVRLSFVFPELPLMQVRAVASAAAALIRDEGLVPKPEVMVPLVALASEQVQMRAVCEQVIDEVAGEYGVALDIPRGTMLELPRACITADEIAQDADFFCFGTNDLTQTTFGFSRDDAESKFIPIYLHKKLLDVNPRSRRSIRASSSSCVWLWRRDAR